MNWYKQAKIEDQMKEAWNWADFGKGVAAPLMLAAPAFLANVPESYNPNNQPSHVEKAPQQSPAPETTQIQPTQPVQPTQTKEEVPQEIPQGNVVSRIIFSEASPIVSNEERELVATTIMNRKNHRGFGRGKLEDMEDVVTQPGAFEALNDPRNSNWARSGNPQRFSGKELQAWLHSVELSEGNFTPIQSPSGRPIVYYHDKSIEKPSSWDNKYWKAIKEIETPHFIFYSVVPAK